MNFAVFAIQFAVCYVAARAIERRLVEYKAHRRSRRYAEFAAHARKWGI